jgi:hypothetical protein
MDDLLWAELMGTITWKMLLHEFMDAMEIVDDYKAAHPNPNEADGATLLAISGPVIIWPVLRSVTRGEASVLAESPPKPIVDLVLSVTRRASA